MYDVMVVDDHRVFITQLRRLEVWDRHSGDFSLKYLVEDSREALEQLEKKPVDILITDIKMPRLNGLDLLKTAKEKNLCKCAVVMSEFAEFDYARQAMLCGALDYLVKPVSDESLSAALVRAADYLNHKVRPQGDRVSVQAQTVAQCIIENGTGFERRLTLLLELCMASADRQNTISGIVYGRAVSEVCSAVFGRFPWLREIVPDRERITEKIMQAEDDIIAAEITGRYLGELKRSASFYYPPGMNSLTENIVNYILENIHSDFSLSDVSEACYVNKTHLSHIFKQNLGISFVDYITNFKMQRLKILLDETELKLSELAESLCFDDYKYMGRLFKKVYGVSPSEYRKGSAEAR